MFFTALGDVRCIDFLNLEHLSALDLLTVLSGGELLVEPGVLAWDEWSNQSETANHLKLTRV